MLTSIPDFSSEKTGLTASAQGGARNDLGRKCWHFPRLNPANLENYRMSAALTSETTFYYG
jgi:hypothetical protein